MVKLDCYPFFLPASNLISSSFSRPCLESFHKHPMEIDLTQACVGELNTTIRGDTNWPIIYGVGVNTRTGEIFPATFPDKGPDIQLRLVFFMKLFSGFLRDFTSYRNARHFTGGHQVLDIYDSQLGMLRIGPFIYDPVRGVDLWLSQSDEFILQQLSTSPEVEPPHFVMQVRATLKYIQDNQFPGNRNREVFHRI